MKPITKKVVTWTAAIALLGTMLPMTNVLAATETQPPQMPNSTEGTPPDMPTNGTIPSGGGANTMTYDYTGTYSGMLAADGAVVTSDKKSYTTTTADQNAALVQNAGTLYSTNDTFTKSGDDTDGDRCNFYGVNAIVLSANEGSKAYISNATLSASSEGSNGLFATDNGTIYANQDTITTTAGNARGLDATYGGTIIANQLTISTKGDHCASIATDRGGGNISVTNSSLQTQGSGSPLLYSTGEIELCNSKGTASGSQIAGMEGLNTIRIFQSDLTSTITGKTASDPIADGVIIYQSTSGDADTSTGEKANFEASDSTLTSSITSGAMFYVTNVTANIVLSNTKLNFDTTKANLLVAAGNDANNWGTAGSNGGLVTLTGRNQTLAGNIQVDTISSLDLYLLDNSTYTGSTSIQTNTVNTKKTSAPITMNLDSSSTWVVTADATVSNLNVENGGKIVDADGKTVSILVNGTKQVEGTSAVTVTVTGTYATTVTTTSSNSITKANIDRTAFDTYYKTTTAFDQIQAEESTTTVTVPKKVTIKSVTSTKTKKLTLKWTKNTEANGYQIYLSTDKNFKKNVTKKLVTKATITKITFTKLTKNTKYYVKIRAYKLVDGKKQYGSFSKVKSVKVK